MRVLAALLALAAVSAPWTAHAYCRSTTRLDFTPTETQPCDNEGKPLFWASRCITMLVNRQASAKVDLETARTLLGKSFGKWSSVTCDACGTPGSPSLVGTEGGPTDCGFGYLREGTNTNVLIFYDKNWPREPGQLALTTVTFKKDTGEILDADMEVDATQPLSTTGEADAYDLESILTHEVGHVLGLAHSGDPNATMRPRYEAGDTTIRNLTADDTCGICAAAPPGRDAPCNATSGTCTATGTDAGPTPTTDAGTPAGDTSVGDPADAPGYTCGCSAPGRTSRLAWPAIALGLLAIRLRSRNARSSRSRPS
jgi:hypothetical protein